jgi:hypothetical protein
MAKIEPGVYEPRGDDIRVFDGAEDDVDEEGSRLPLLIVIALLVLAAFAGVVYLAYTEGVQKGRADLPRVISAQPGPAKVAPTDAGGSVTPYKGLKIYEQPAPTDEDTNDQDSAPQPPTEIKPATPAPTAPSAALAPPPTTAKPMAMTPAPTTTQTPPPSTTKPMAMAPAPTPAVTQVKPTPTPPKQTQVATAAPRSLTPPATAATKPAAVETKPLAAVPAPAPQTAAPAAAAPSGSYLVQVASYPSEAEAQTAFAELKRKNGALLSGYTANVKRVDLGAKGVWYRLRVGPVADKDAAAALASRIGGGSFPTKP